MLSYLLGAGLALMLWGLGSFWVRSTGDPDARARGLRMIGAFVLLIAVSAAGIFGLYIHWHDSASTICREGEDARSVAAMRDAFERSAEDRTKIAFFNESVFTCNMLEAALAQLDAGECPEDVPSDARCLCGNQRYPDEWSGGPARCDSYDPVADRYGGGRRLRAGH
ncbi:MAG: hypothetical protein R3B72_27680 [Polyangiaceae bacterium]